MVSKLSETAAGAATPVASAANTVLLMTAVPMHAVDRSYYSDWGDPREYTIGDMGVGECAGEVVSVVEFGLAASERVVFEALIDLENGAAEAAADKAYDAMLQAAKAMNQSQNVDSADDEDEIVREFRTRFHDTKIFHDPFADPSLRTTSFTLTKRTRAIRPRRAPIDGSRRRSSSWRPPMPATTG